MQRQQRLLCGCLAPLQRLLCLLLLTSGGAQSTKVRFDVLHGDIMTIASLRPRAGVQGPLAASLKHCASRWVATDDTAGQQCAAASYLPSTDTCDLLTGGCESQASGRDARLLLRIGSNIQQQPPSLPLLQQFITATTSAEQTTKKAEPAWTSLQLPALSYDTITLDLKPLSGSIEVAESSMHAGFLQTARSESTSVSPTDEQPATSAKAWPASEMAVSSTVRGSQEYSDIDMMPRSSQSTETSVQHSLTIDAEAAPATIAGSSSAGQDTNQPTKALITTTQPTSIEPTSNQPITSQQTTTQSITTLPTTSQQTTTQTTTNQPTTTQPTTALLTATQPIIIQPATTQPTTTQLTTTQSTTNQPATTQPTTTQPTTTLPTTTQPTMTQLNTSIGAQRIVSLGKTANQSKLAPSSNFEPANAFDGNINTYARIENAPQLPWIYVDLELQYNVTTIAVTARCDQHGNTAHDYDLRVSSSLILVSGFFNGSLCAHFNIAMTNCQSETFTCPPSTVGRYVSFQVTSFNSGGWFNLAEMTVYGFML